VLYWTGLDVDHYETDERIAAIRKVQNYSWFEISTLTKENMPDHNEHIHDHGEIRLILDGSVYFDIRDHDDKWIRIQGNKGDFIELPTGSYHRCVRGTVVERPSEGG
jgi:1,2-dihydroxy-3-keto-5-methylthiopentene dioxygenase